MSSVPVEDRFEEIEDAVHDWVKSNYVDDPLRGYYVNSSEIMEALEGEIDISPRLVARCLPHMDFLEINGENTNRGGSRFRILTDEM